MMIKYAAQHSHKNDLKPTPNHRDVTLGPRPPVIGPGIYITKVISARDKVSENGNDMIVMKLALPDGRSIPSTITFVPAARPVINAFCASADLVLPSEPDVAVDLTASHCLGRYLYVVVVVDADNSGGMAPRVSRFLTRAEALALNPDLAQIVLREQAPLELPKTKPNPFNN